MRWQFSILCFSGGSAETIDDGIGVPPYSHQPPSRLFAVVVRGGVLGGGIGAWLSGSCGWGSSFETLSKL